MAYDATHGFTVQEATNLVVYNDYKYADITVNSTDIGSPDESADWDGEPAKEIILTKKSGDDANTVSIQLKVNGSYGNTIQFLLSDFPLTINGILIERVAFATSDTATDEVLRLLSFH